MASLKDIDRCGDLHTDAFGEFNVLAWQLELTVIKAVIPVMEAEPICLEYLGSTDIYAAVSLNHDGFTKVEIMLGCDSELDSMIDALRSAADKLEDLKNSH